MRKLVRWSSTERFDLAVQSLVIQQLYSVSDLESVRMAMESILPANRHREITGFFQVPWIKSLWVDSKVKNQAVEIIELKNRHQRLDESQAKEVARTVTLNDFSFHELWEELGKRIQSFMGPSLQDMIRSQVNSVLESRIDPKVLNYVSQAEKHDSGKKLPKIAIIGLLPNQFNLIKDSYKDSVDLVLIPGNSPQYLGPIVNSVDKVIQMTKFSNRLPADTKRKLGGRLSLCPYGLDSLRTLLNPYKVA